MNWTRLFSRLFAAGILLVTSLGATACTPTMLGLSKTQPSHVLPKPVTASNGMKLLWGEDVKNTAIDLIDHSQHKVYLDMYELSDPDIIKALVAAKERNVNVEVVLDATEPHSVSTGYPELQKEGVIVRKISIKRGIDHLKMLIVDQNVLIGGMNYGSQSWNNNDASVLIPHAENSFQAMFLWDFNRAGGGVEQAPVVAEPLVYDSAIQTAILKAIQGARHSVAMEAFDLSDKPIVTQLASALSRGVSVSLLVDPSQTYNRTSVDELRDAGAMVRYYHPYEDELMHAKIVDVDQGKTFIIGSANFSHQAFTYNHEADLVLHNVSAFDASLEQDLETEMGRGSDYPVKEKVKTEE